MPNGTPAKHFGTARVVDPFTTGPDTAICEAQRCIVEALELDGSTLFELSADGDLLCTHAWWRPEVLAPPDASLGQRMLPADAREAEGRRGGLPFQP